MAVAVWRQIGHPSNFRRPRDFVSRPSYPWCTSTQGRPPSPTHTSTLLIARARRPVGPGRAVVCPPRLFLAGQGASSHSPSHIPPPPHTHTHTTFMYTRTQHRTLFFFTTSSPRRRMFRSRSLWALLLVVGSATATVHNSNPRSDPTKYLTPGCKTNPKYMKKNVGVCAAESIRLNVDGQLGFLLKDQPWSADELPGPNPDLLFYTPATAIIDGPLFAQNVSVGGYFTVGGITLGPDSDMNDLVGPEG